MKTTRLTSLALSAMVVTALTACTSAGDSVGTIAETELPAKNIDAWVMPLDEFTPPSAGQLANYAENLLTAECLGESGIRWPIPWQPTDDEAYERSNWVRAGMTIEAARERGYHPTMGPSYRTPEESEAIFQELGAIASSTPGFDPLLTACLDEARKDVPTRRLSTDENLVLAWVQNASKNFENAPEVTKTTDAWQNCMTTAGYPETPSSPFEMVTSFDALGIPPLYGSGADGAPLSPLTQAEIELAVADATCQESSGWTQAIYDTQWDAQVKVLSEHADELVRMRDQWNKDREVLLQIIAEHAPAQ